MKLASKETCESLPDHSSENVCAQAARELTGVNDRPKAQESQVAGVVFLFFCFFCKAAELSEMRKDATDTKRRVSTCSSLSRHRSTQPPHRGTWQDSEHLPRVASSGSISVKKQRNLFRTVYDLSNFYRKELCSQSIISDCFISPIFRSPCFH